MTDVRLVNFIVTIATARMAMVKRTTDTIDSWSNVRVSDDTTFPTEMDPDTAKTASDLPTNPESNTFANGSACEQHGYGVSGAGNPCTLIAIFFKFGACGVL